MLLFTSLAQTVVFDLTVGCIYFFLCICLGSGIPQGFVKVVRTTLHWFLKLLLLLFASIRPFKVTHQA